MSLSMPPILCWLGVSSVRNLTAPAIRSTYVEAFASLKSLAGIEPALTKLIGIAELTAIPFRNATITL
jgi:hypothetical protein